MKTVQTLNWSPVGPLTTYLPQGALLLKATKAGNRYNVDYMVDDVGATLAPFRLQMVKRDAPIPEGFTWQQPFLIVDDSYLLWCPLSVAQEQTTTSDSSSI